MLFNCDINLQMPYFLLFYHVIKAYIIFLFFCQVDLRTML